MGRARTDVYLANRLFSDGERTLNDAIASRLRAMGLTVFVPQEEAHNAVREVTAAGIFLNDHRALRRSAVMLAVLDGDTPDAGVACEIGLARANGIPIVGIWSDFRQDRAGAGRPLLNIFIEGAVKQNGVLCRSAEEAASACREIVRSLSPDARRNAVIEHFTAARTELEAALAWLPGAYEPPFDPGAAIVEELNDALAAADPTIVDLGAGTGWLRDAVGRRWPDARYVPIDPAHGERTSVGDGEADAVVLSFVLHDQPEPTTMLAEASRMLRIGGSLVVLDLTPQDLPRLSALLLDLDGLALPLDRRIDVGTLADAGAAVGFAVASAGLIVRGFRFDAADRLRSYIRAFGLDSGQDLPWLPLAPHAAIAEAAVDGLTYPFRDRRTFIACRLSKRSPYP